MVKFKMGQVVKVLHYENDFTLREIVGKTGKILCEQGSGYLISIPKGKETYNPEMYEDCYWWVTPKYLQLVGSQQLFLW